MKVRIGISSCLLGSAVRYDGGHKRDRFLTDTLGRFVEWVAVCPEVEAGFGIPREAMRLVARGSERRLVTTKNGADVTERMTEYAARRIRQLGSAELSGFVLKKDSPSCGLERVKVYQPHGMATRSGQGVFAAALQAHLPDLPIEEEGRLSDPRLRENFIERVFAYRRLCGLFSRHWSIGDLVAFHTAHKLTVMAHSAEAYAQLGRLVARARLLPRTALQARYGEQFMAALARMATPRRHANVLQHIAGHFKTRLDAAARHEIGQLIDDYRVGLIPLIVPITLIRHHVRAHDVPYLAGQVYLEPHPKELMLRNHV